MDCHHLENVEINSEPLDDTVSDLVKKNNLISLITPLYSITINTPPHNLIYCLKMKKCDSREECF